MPRRSLRGQDPLKWNQSLEKPDCPAFRVRSSVIKNTFLTRCNDPAWKQAGSLVQLPVL